MHYRNGFFCTFALMTTIRDYIKKAEYVKANLLVEQERIILNHENDIVRLNTSQFEQGEGSDDADLFNTDKRYLGFYKFNTPGKTAGQLYNFYETGAFLSGLQLNIFPNLIQFSIFSTGTGSGDKKAFFDGYTNLFGLNKNNSNIVNWELIYPDLMNYIKKYL